MLDYEGAVAVAEKELANVEELPDGDSLVLLLQHTIERPFGWVFLYTSRLYRETGEFRYALAGNAPFFVDRRSGVVVRPAPRSPWSTTSPSTRHASA